MAASVQPVVGFPLYSLKQCKESPTRFWHQEIVGIACCGVEMCRFFGAASSRTHNILVSLLDAWHEASSICTEASAAGLLSAFFPPGFLLALTQGRDLQAQNSFSSFTLMKLRRSSALGGASLGARYIGHHLPMDYSMNAVAFYSYTF